jgi:hypothetical protein
MISRIFANIFAERDNGDRKFVLKTFPISFTDNPVKNNVTLTFALPA